MTDDSMTAAAPATLNEPELFGAFIGLTIKSRTVFGSAKKAHVSHEYTPDDYLRDGSCFPGYEDIADMIADYVSSDEDPELALDNLAQGFSAYADQLKTVLRDFHSFKSAHLVQSHLPVEAPEDAAQCKVWEAAWDEYDNNPRFHVPAVTEGEAA